MRAELWLTLQQAIGYGSAKLPRILYAFKTIDQLLNSGIEVLRESGIFTAIEISRLLKPDMTEIRNIIKESEQNGISIITFEDTGYPERLKYIPDPPTVLFVKGDLPAIDDEVAIAIVGPRQVSEFGAKAAFSLAVRISKAGALVVSGGAVGADCYAHRGALATGAKTVAVLGCGILYPYLMENAELRNKISENGALLSEYPPNFRCSKFTFPVRNRLMSGLSLGTVIVEAGEKSGSFITARHAADQGRDLFVIPGNPTEAQYAGSNLLLKDGAKPLLNAMDILEEYVDRFPHKLNLTKAFRSKSSEKSEKFKEVFPAKETQIRTKNKEIKIQITETFKKTENPNVSKSAAEVYKAFPDNIEGMDQLAEICSVNSGTLMGALTELEIMGYIKAVPGGRYEIIK